MTKDFRDMTREEQFVELAKQFATIAATEGEIAAELRIVSNRLDEAKRRREISETKLREFVGRNVPVKQTVIAGKLVRVKHQTIGDYGAERITVTLEDLT